MTMQSRVRLGIQGEYSIAADNGSLIRALAHAADIAFADGVGLNAASEFWTDEVSVAQSVNTDIDLQTLTKPDGSALVLTGVKAVLISAAAANPAALTLQPGASNGWTAVFGGTTPTTPIAPGGAWIQANPSAGGFAVSGSNKTVRIASPGTTGTYVFRISVLGITA